MTDFRQLEHNEVKNNKTQKEIILFVEPILTPQNIGSIFRIAEAMGVSKIYWKDNSMNFTHKKITKTARNTNEYIPYEIVENYHILEEYKKQKVTITALEITTNAENIYTTELELAQKFVLIVGSEGHGISKEALSYCDKAIYIPMFGQNTSINVAVSLGIALSTLNNR